MNITRKFSTAVATLTFLVSLGGCLSDDTLTTDTGSAPPPPSGNSAPTISGNPASAILVAEAYSFTPQASDPDGDTLTFSIQNRPSWATFDTGTGRLSGTPTLGDTGNYTNINISVSDGALTDSMAAFAIDVTQVATGSTTLSWTAPTLNEDGSALTDLTGYKLFYGRSSGNYSNEIPVDAGMTTYVVSNLSPDTYYFAAKAVSASGGDSRFSGEAVRVVN